MSEKADRHKENRYYWLHEIGIFYIFGGKMKKHDDFDLWLHDDVELAKIHGTNVITRERIRGWPLSVVERIVFNDGASRIYKAYRNTPAEMMFYRQIRSRHIPKIYHTHSADDRHWLLLEDVKGQHPADLTRDELIDLACRAGKIINSTGAIELCRYDLSARGYDDFAVSVIELLSALHENEKLKTVNGETIKYVKAALLHTEVKRTVDGECTLLHGDLKCDNILIRPDGSLVIVDWQNTLFGPEEIDIYTLLASQDADPLPVAGIGPEILRSALTIKWFADCIDRWLPYWSDFYDKQIDKTVTHMKQMIETI
jgi:serine/threonine protein kinase